MNVNTRSCFAISSVPHLRAPGPLQHAAGQAGGHNEQYRRLECGCLRPYWYQPGPPAAALEGVRTRRVFALLVDLILITLMAIGFFFVLLVLGIVTFGLTWFLIPPLFPAGRAHL